MSNTMPVLFFGHGTPMNALWNNAYTEGWAALGRRLPRPKAVLVVSAHWYIPATAVTANAQPPTIHDFGGFPKALHEIQYPAPGSTGLAERVRELLAPVAVQRSEQWGLDHGTWSVLCHVYPQADVPVVQLSIDETQPPRFHYELGKRLTPLREEGVLVIGSGNLVHNLPLYVRGESAMEPFDWVVSFEAKARKHLLDGDDAPLIDYPSLGPEATLAVPTPEHYLPLLYVMGMRSPKDDIRFPVEGFDGGSMSMLTVQFG